MGFYEWVAHWLFYKVSQPCMRLDILRKAPSKEAACPALLMTTSSRSGQGRVSAHPRAAVTDPAPVAAVLCKAKMQYLLTCKSKQILPFGFSRQCCGHGCRCCFCCSCRSLLLMFMLRLACRCGCCCHSIAAVSVCHCSLSCCFFYFFFRSCCRLFQTWRCCLSCCFRYFSIHSNNYCCCWR